MALEIEHRTVNANGAQLHVACAGEGPSLLLLHGWPEYWWTWTPVIERLADRFRLIAPDLRGFGDSDKPAGDYGPARHAQDVAALIEAMDLAPVGIVSHDVGASVAQGLVRTKPELVSGLFFFNLVYPGIGARFTTPEHLRFVWHTYFNQSEIAPALLRGGPNGIRLFIEHFVTLWAYRKEAIDADLINALAANMAKPGNLEGGFAYYRGAADERAQAAARGETPQPIALPTCVRWTERDTALRIAWADRLSEFFTDLDFAPFPDAGHFPHHEQPDRAAAEIAGFFDRLASRP
jgi:pimeloyl-ACP methyl ester carboxylesterase